MERHCKNCSRLLYAGQDFCPTCGSRWVDYRLTPRSITIEFSNRYLGTDNKFLLTLLHLFRFPENVINGYISGRRKKYVNPASFYLISLTFVGLQIFLMKTFTPELLGFTEEVSKTSVKGFLDYFYDYLGLFTTIFIPLYAITGVIVFLDLKKYNFAEHLIFYIYVFGLSNIVIALLTPFFMVFEVPYTMISLALTPLSFLQIAWYYKRCFKLTLGTTILKSIMAIILFGFIQLIFTAFLAILILGGIYVFQPELLSNLKIG